MNISKTSLKWLAHLGDAFAPKNETSRQVRLGTALVILLAAVVAYIALL